MTTATKSKTKIKNIYGIVNAFGYQIIDQQTDNILYEAGNNPKDSSPTQSLPADMGVGVATLKEWANLTGNEMAQEHGAKWLGVCVRPFI